MALGVCTNCSSSFPPSAGQKWKILQFFFDIMTTYNDGICYVGHVLDPLCVLLTLFGCGGGGVAPKGSGVQPAHAVFPPQQQKNENFAKLIFLILWPSKTIKYPM